MDWHHFRTETDISGADGNLVATSGTAGAAMETDLGSEVDLTLAHKYDANTKIVFGYSHYWTTTTFAQVNEGAGSLFNSATANDDNGAGQNDGADWGYIMIDTKF
jgi:hypothetical protein